MSLRKRFASVAVMACAALMAGGEAYGQATLKGRFVYDGSAPAPDKIVPTQDVAICGKHNLVRQQLVVGKDGGLANVVIWLTTKDIPAPADAPPPAPAVLDNKECRFEPHVVLMRVSQPLEIKNSDPTGHNTKGSPKNTPEFNVLIPANGSQTIKTLTKSERQPFEVQCSIHPWMNGWVLVQEGPFTAVTDADGKFEIKRLPDGKPLEFQLWQEKARNLKNLPVSGKKSNAFGRVTLTLKSGDNDLGDIKVPASAFK